MINHRHLFDAVALDYEARIIPAFGPLAQDLIAWTAPHPNAIALDVGTGTGIAARLLAAHVRRVIGLDFSFWMVNIGQHHHNFPHLHLIQSDAHHLSLATNSVDLCVASFGFNATDPRRVFPELQRVLRPGGQLCFQEWGGLHEYDRLIVDVLETYAVYDEDASPALVALRDFLEIERPWYQHMQTEDDFRDELEAVGFASVDVQEHAPVTLRLDVSTFMHYKLAWKPRAAELEAMDPLDRADCLDQLRAQLYDHTDASNQLAYTPLLFRVRATNGAE